VLLQIAMHMSTSLWRVRIPGSGVAESGEGGLGNKVDSGLFRALKGTQYMLRRYFWGAYCLGPVCGGKAGIRKPISVARSDHWKGVCRRFGIRVCRIRTYLCSPQEANMFPWRREGFASHGRTVGVYLIRNRLAIRSNEPHVLHLKPGQRSR
jgi:hypothetical protein